MYGYDVMVPWFYNSQLFGEMLWSSRDDGIMAVQGPLFWCLWYHHPPMGSLMAPFPMWHPLGLGMYILDCMYVHIYDKLHLNRWIYIQSQHKESSTYTKLTWLQYDLNPPNGHASTIAFFLWHMLSLVPKNLTNLRKVQWTCRASILCVWPCEGGHDSMKQKLISQPPYPRICIVSFNVITRVKWNSKMMKTDVGRHKCCRYKYH